MHGVITEMTYITWNSRIQKIQCSVKLQWDSDECKACTTSWCTNRQCSCRIAYIAAIAAAAPVACGAGQSTERIAALHLICRPSQTSDQNSH